MNKSITKQPPKLRRGFAAMSKAEQLRICTMGGKTCAQKLGKNHMARIGRKGGSKKRVP